MLPKAKLQKSPRVYFPHKSPAFFAFLRLVLLFSPCTLAKKSVILYNVSVAEVAEWQTQGT